MVWESIDRFLNNYSSDGWRQKALNKAVESLKFHLGMVFQRFLDKTFENVQNVAILLNEEPIEPWDPFCKAEKETKSLVKHTQPIQINETGEMAEFNIEAWLLPREEDFSTAKAKNAARVNNDMQGFYVYRENRLIHYGSWLGTYRNEPHYSSLRIEFSFDHKLDEAFNVDIKKSRILLDDAIFEYLKDSFLPAPRREANNTYRNSVNKRIKAATNEAHNASNANIDPKAKSVQGADIKVTNPSTGEVEINNKLGKTTGKIKVIPLAVNGNYRVVPVDSIESGLLWEPTLVEGRHAVSINKTHDFYRKVYAPNIGNSRLIQAMDSLLWALSEAEISTYNQDTREQYEDMRIQVSRIIKKLVADFPEPDFQSEADDCDNEE